MIVRSKDHPQRVVVESILAELLPRTTIRSDVSVTLVDSEIAYCGAGSERVVVTTELVGRATPAQLRALIGHELAHVERGGEFSKPHREFRADRRSIELTDDAPSLACGLLLLGRERASATHPSTNDRLTAIGEAFLE